MLETSVFTQDVPGKGVTDGHVHFELLSSAEEDVALVGICANVAGSILFEKLGAQGTNLIMNLTADGGTVDVVARSEDDGLGLLWQPKQFSEQQLDDIRGRLRGKTMELEHDEEPDHGGQVPSEDDEETEEALVKQLLRIP